MIMAGITNSKAPAGRLSKSEWYARKQERREKQRLANGGRALKMREARLAAPSPSPSSGAGELPLLNIGCSGWFYWDWREKFYPAGMPTKEWFPHYREHF